MVSITTQEYYFLCPKDVKPSEKTAGGGVVTKMMNVKEAMPNIHFDSEFRKLGDIAMIDPLCMHTPDWDNNIIRLQEHGEKSVKLLWNEEQEIMRWSVERRQEMFGYIDGYLVSNKYLKQLLSMYDLSPMYILYTPINQDRFTPKPKKKQVVAVGKIGLQKNTDAIIKLFKELPDDITKVYIGNAGLWGFVTYPHDLCLQREVSEVADVYIESATQEEVADIMSESLYYANFSIYDVGCLSFLEAAMSGCYCFTWNYHPMFDEYENVIRVQDVAEAVELMDCKTLEPNLILRKEIMGKHSYPSFQTQLEKIIGKVVING